MSSLTFVYADSTAVLGPLSRDSEPHAYDLCRDHASRMTAPRGWELLRVAGGEDASDDLVALADAVRPRQAPTDETGQRSDSPSPRAPRRRPEDSEPGRHLHVLRSTND